ncbi:MAG: heavy metal translocating P-type ATPase metal-binding domain-containing protein [Putridiphycobacter sp.]|nr:heavy metal translocating P-type ATPase metal-binding domain-containing protein [Putridiphycobacter sp.]
MAHCFHCGDNCEEIVHFDDKTFCCEGCKTVYDILNLSNLDSYYNIDETSPGIKANKTFRGKYNFLDLPEFKEKLILFQEGTTTKIKLFLPQIHCSSCLWLLERLDKLAPGIISSHVFFVKKEAEIAFNNSKISLKQVAELLASIGYPPAITLEDYDKTKKAKSNKSLIFKIGLVGFCFGNVMLLSFPEYLGISDRDKDFQTTFNYLNLLFSIPVLVYGAKDYIISAYKSIKNKRVNIDVPISIGIFALYLRSLYEVVFEQGAGYFDSFIGLIFFLLLGKWFQQQTYSAINFERDYKSYFPIAVTKISNAIEEIIPLRKVEVGDVLRIRNNELIPADSVMKNGNGQIDYSFVTGESIAIEKKSGDKLYAGGRQTGEAIEIIIDKKIENSYLTQLWNNPIFDTKAEKETLTDVISRRFTILLLAIAAIAGIYWYLTEPGQAAFIVVSILIVACPCAIALSVPFTYGNGIRVFGRKGFYLRSVHVIEPLAKVSDIVFDKTGTITQNNLNSIRYEGKTLSSKEKGIIKRLTANSAHPLSRQVSGFIAELHVDEVHDFEEIQGKGITGTVDGMTFKIGHKDWIGARFDDQKTRVCVSVNDQIKGAFVIENFYREGLVDLFNNLDSAKYKLHILSGDNEAEREKLTQFMPAGTVYHFNQKPEDKLAYIDALQANGASVMMLGDGLNDAGALQTADIGISVVDDVYSFTPSSDAIINGDKLKHLHAYIKYAKYNMTVVKWSYVFSLFYNIIGLSFAITGHLKPLIAAILMPLSSITVVLLVTILTNLRGRKLE